MTTCNAGRRTTATRGGGTSEHDDQEGERSGDQAGSGRCGQGTGRGSHGGGRGGQGSGRGSQGGGRDGQESDQGSQVSSRGNRANGGGGGVPDFANDNVINDNNQGNVRTVNMNNSRGGCSYKEFMACNPKGYDGKGSAIVYTRWIEKMESVQDMSGCEENQKVKYTADYLIGKALTWCNSQVQTRGREAAVDMTWEDFKALTREELCLNNEMQKMEIKLVPHLVTHKNKRIERYIHGLAPQIRAMVAVTEPTTIQSVVLKAGMLTDEAIKNGALKKISENRGNNGEPSRDGNVRDDNKRSRTGRAFATITNPVRKEYTGAAPKCLNCNYYHQPEVPCRLCTKSNRFEHIAKDCRMGPRVVNPLNARNPTTARGACFECGGTDHYKAACS
ncbi:hypothetical protein Tco_1188838, partial [Tanacetum coccineum]